MSYLGHIISGSGISPKTDLLAAIRLAPSPLDKDQLKSFLGLCEYYARFIQNFSLQTEPLRKLLKSKVPFLWSDEQETAFHLLKSLIITAPALQPFKDNLLSTITVDASGKGLGAIFSQFENGKENTVAFASRTLSDAEKNYSTIEKEALACVWVHITSQHIYGEGNSNW